MEAEINIQAYIESKKYAWAPTTLEKERSRLVALEPFITGDPEFLWKNLGGYKPYTRVTAWTRAADYWKFKTGQDIYHNWRKENARVFKNTYQKTIPEIGYREAKEKISKIQDQEIQRKAYQLLKGGLRYRESLTIQSGHCTGKGGKQRKVFVKEVEWGRSYDTLRRALRKVGLKPHDLRKIRVMDLCRKGARPEEICAVTGWSNYNTAQSYIQADKQVIEKMMED